MKKQPARRVYCIGLVEAYSNNSFVRVWCNWTGKRLEKNLNQVCPRCKQRSVQGEDDE